MTRSRDVVSMLLYSISITTQSFKPQHAPHTSHDRGQFKLTRKQNGEERRNYLINNTNTPGTEEYTDKKRHTPLLRALAAQPPGEGEIFGLDRHALGVDRSEVGVLEERDEVRLGRLLQRHDGGGLEAQVGLCGAP